MCRLWRISCLLDLAAFPGPSALSLLSHSAFWLATPSPQSPKLITVTLQQCSMGTNSTCLTLRVQGLSLVYLSLEGTERIRRDLP